MDALQPETSPNPSQTGTTVTLGDRFDDGTPKGDEACHLSRETLVAELGTLTPPRHNGRVEVIVIRNADGTRELPDRCLFTPEHGAQGDKWSLAARGSTDDQISIMRADVARLLANDQSLSLFGDNLLVKLDLSPEHLPPGTRLRVGQAIMEVTPEPHTGCSKFRQRFGLPALQLTADPAYKTINLRGIYLRVLEAGHVSCGDAIVVTLPPRNKAAP